MVQSDTVARCHAVHLSHWNLSATLMKSFICWNVMLKHFYRSLSMHTEILYSYVSCFMSLNEKSFHLQVSTLLDFNLMNISCNMVERHAITLPENWKPSIHLLLKRRAEVKWDQPALRGGGCCRIALETLNNCFSTSAETLMNKQRLYNWEH